MKKKAWIVAAVVGVIAVLLLWISATRSGPGEKLKIGRILPLTGAAASCGESEKKGTLLAVEEVNAADGIERRPLEILFEDSRSSAADGVKAMKKLVEVDKVPAVLGATTSAVTLAVSPIANEHKVLLLAPLPSAPAITQAGPFVFRVTPSDDFAGRVLADWMFSDGHRKVAMLHVDNAWGKGVAAEFERALAGLGGTILRTEACNQGDTDFRPQLNRIRDAKPSALFCPTTTQQGVIILRQMKELGMALRVYGADGWTVDKLLPAALDAANGVMYVRSADYAGREYQVFAVAFRAKYGEEPDANAAGAYDAVKILAACMSKVAEGDLPLTGENIRHEMLKVKDYQGATGAITFDENGDSVAKTFEKMMMRVSSPHGGHPYYSVIRAPTTKPAGDTPK